MGDLKPIGSEKLDADKKLKRILELTYYQTPSDSTKSSVIVEQTTTGVYGIVREKDGYYVKKGRNENSLDYIGGLFMKNKNRFNSYGEAFKKAEFLVEQEKLQEATKYVLKTPKPPALKPQEEGPMPMPTDEMPPAPAPSAEQTPPPPPGEGLSPETKMGDEEMPSPEGEEEDFKKVIQKLSGKLQQKLTAYKDKLESADIKAAIMQVLSGVDLQTQLDETDKEEILSAFEPEDEVTGDEGSSEDMPSETGDTTPPAEDELGEIDGIASLEELINNPFEDDNEEISEENPFGDDEYVPDDDEPDETDRYLSDVLKTSKGAKGAALKDMSGEFEDEDDNEPEGLTPNTEPSDEEDIDDEELDELLSDFGNMDTRNSVPEEDMSEELPISGSEQFSEPEGSVKELDINELTDMVNTSVKETLSKYFES